MSFEQYQDARILVIDDVEPNVELILTLLEDDGYTNVHGVNDPRLVKEEIANHFPDLILLDVRMPYLSGLDLMKWIKQEFGDSAPSVIFLTAQIDEQTRYNALELGAQDFLTKPFDHGEVLQRIRNTLQSGLLSKQRAQRANRLALEVAQRTEDLQTTSRQDPVTELPNRRRIVEVLTDWEDTGEGCSVFLLQFDGLDDITSLHDYSISDEVLCLLAERFSSYCLSANDFLGVWGSHEWIVVSEPDMSTEQIEAKAMQLVRLTQEPIFIRHMRFQLSVRIGISAHEHNHWVRNAALALPQKLGTFQIYDIGLESRYIRKTEMRQALALSIVNNELFLMFQPKVAADSAQIMGAEVLLRWQSERFGLVSPVEFIPLLESTGMIVDVGAWVMNQSLEHLARWREEGKVPEHFSLAVNVSSIQLMEPAFAEQLIDRLEFFSIPHDLLEVEVTESSMMQDMDLALEQLEVLTKAGIRIALDDFGTGYSSLAYLRNLPISVLKVDRAFIKEIHHNQQDLKVTESVLDLAKHMNFTTVAEGVELSSQLQLLREMGCDLIQGFYFSPPLNQTSLLALLNQDNVFEALLDE